MGSVLELDDCGTHHAEIPCELFCLPPSSGGTGPLGF
jgi:hypothetical protein